MHGGGLMLVVTSKSSASSKLRAMVAGKRRDIGLGSLKVLSLAEARDKAADLLRHKNHRRPSRRMITLAIQHHPYRSLADLWRKLVPRPAHSRSTFSGVGASDRPGAVHFVTMTTPYTLRLRVQA